MHDPGAHPCPVRECPRRVPLHLLMCGLHWRMVPPPMQRAVNAAWNGSGPLAPLLAAQRTAINAVNAQLATTAPGGRDE